MRKPATGQDSAEAARFREALGAVLAAPKAKVKRRLASEKRKREQAPGE